MKGILFIDFLIQNDFLNTRSRQWSFLLTNQNAHLRTYEPMKFRVTKVTSKFKSSASKRASCKWKRYQLWIFPAKSLGEMPKVRWKQRKCSKYLRFCEERTSRWMTLRLIALERDVNLPDLAVEKMVEKLNRSSCLVKFCWFGIIAQAGRVEFTAAKSEDIKPIILVSCLVHSSKFKWSFFEHLTAKTRQPIGHVKFDFKTVAV